MFIAGYSVNVLTMFGMVLAIGIIVDDAIVVVENVERVMEENPGLSPVDAARRAMREITGAILAITFVRYQLGAAPPEEPISGRFGHLPIIEALFLGGLWGIIALAGFVIGGHDDQRIFSAGRPVQNVIQGIVETQHFVQQEPGVVMV